MPIPSNQFSMMTGVAPEQDLWRQIVLTLRPNLRFEPRKIKGINFVVIEDVTRGKFFQVGSDEFDIISSIDGQKSIEEIAKSLTGVDSEESTHIERGSLVAQWLVQFNLAYSETMDSSSRLHAQQQSLDKAKLIGLINPISIKTKLFNPNEILKRFQPWCNWCFHPATHCVWIAMALIAIWTIFTRWNDLGTASVGILSGGRWIWMLLMWLVLKVIHEAAHGVACRRYGGDVPEAGVLFLLFTPMAYVNVTSMWRFADRWHRIVVAAAGMYVELFISFLAIIVWDRSTGVTADVAFQVFLMASVTTILFNANPLMRFDGYFMLSDLLNIPNLYTKGTRWFGDRIKHHFFGVSKTSGICPPDERLCVAIYGCLAFFWKISISLGLIIASSVLFQGAGVVLAVIGTLLWFGMPLWQQYRLLFGENAKQQVDRTRTLISCAVTALLLIGMFTFFRAPSIKSAPAIVQFRDETIVRAGADGFIDKVLVTDGKAVKAGDPLILLRNPTLTLEVEQLRREAEEARIQSRIHQQKHETSLAQSQLEKHASLLEQAAEKQKQADELTVRAEFDGFVFQRGLSNSEGSFAKRGTALLTLARQQTKEVIVSVDQKDLESLRQNDGEPIRVIMPGVSVFHSSLTKVDPTASSRPSHISLCAHVNGPLPVQAASSSESTEDVPTMELLTPRVKATVALDESLSTKLKSGQIGRAFFKSRSQSLGSYLFLAASDWLKAQLDQAADTAVF